MEYQRKLKECRPVVAICYDFDKTLSPNDMQADGYIQSLGYDVNDFWIKSNGMAKENDMDKNLSYMYTMITEAEGKLIPNKEKLAEYGSKVKLYEGVTSWFSRIRKYGDKKGVIIEHYIISSGLKEMIEGTLMAKNGEFEKIYASSFYFDEHGLPKWPAQVINYTNKTQFLFRIEKGVLDINDPTVNDYFKSEELRVPFRNIIYLGDSDTDVPCMKLVNTYGGHSIGVYDPHTLDKTKVLKMIRENRIRYFVPADYRNGKDIDVLIKRIIDKTASYELLEKWHVLNHLEADDASKIKDKLDTATQISRIKNDKSVEIPDLLSQLANRGIDESEFINLLNDYPMNKEVDLDFMYKINGEDTVPIEEILKYFRDDWNITHDEDDNCQE